MTIPERTNIFINKMFDIQNPVEIQKYKSLEARNDNTENSRSIVISLRNNLRSNLLLYKLYYYSTLYTTYTIKVYHNIVHIMFMFTLHILHA